MPVLCATVTSPGSIAGMRRVPVRQRSIAPMITLRLEALSHLPW